MIIDRRIKSRRPGVTPLVRQTAVRLVGRRRLAQLSQGRRGSFPWRDGNRFELLPDGPPLFARLLEAIRAARRYVLLEMYLIESGRTAVQFVEALAAAARRGVHVAVLLDGFGSLGLGADERKRLAESGVQVRDYNAIRWHRGRWNLRRDHRKLLVVDGERAFVGGFGITDEFAGSATDSPPWRDVAVEIRGPVIADWQRLFKVTWTRSGGFSRWPPFSVPDGVANGIPGRVVASDGWHRAALADSIVERIDGAGRRTWVVSAYFVPSRRFRKALRRAVRRGVDVRLLVPGEKTDHPLVRHAARRFYGKLLRNGVRIFEYQPRVLHAKMVICDDWVSVGSSNLDRWSFKWNLEANQEVLHSGFADAAAARLMTDLQQSIELDRRAWPRRARLDRLQESFAGLLDRTLERWLRRKGD